ncbi:MAG TPA: ATP-binding protein [Blastocatellia bacterium]|nr:ATP-binding protein [Blastocatellia bacterium]
MENAPKRRITLSTTIATTNDRLSQAPRAAGLGLWEWDLETQLGQGSVEWFRLHGLEPREFLTLDQWRATLYSEDRLQQREPWAAEVNAGGPFTSEYRVVWPDGTIRWLLAAGQVIFDGRGQPIRLLGVVSDLTDRKLAEEERERLLESERKAREAADAAGRAKDDYIAVISHELRSPLNAMLGWANILASKTPPDHETTVKAIDVIKRSARQQLQLIEDLLDTTRISRGKLKLETKPVNLVSVIERAFDVVSPAAEAKAIAIKEVLDATAGQVTGDPDRLQQVVWNLLSNAIKFTPAGGEVEIRLERVGSHARLSVRDFGCGIKPELLPHVFDRFRQGDASSTRRHAGLGLGLNLVRQLTELHGGTVGVESAGEGQGATFTLNLPIAPEFEKSHGIRRQRYLADGERHGLPVDSLTGLRILVIDDEADAREILSAILASYGIVVKSCGSAGEALAALVEWHPDLLISDIGMPGEDGYTLIRKIRSLAPEQGGTVPAIALTAYTRAEDRVRALAAGYKTHVPKPVDPAELAVVIAALAGRLERERVFT